MKTNTKSPVLSADQLAFWERNGYVVVPDAVPAANLEATIAAVWEFLEMDPADRESWYRYRPATRDDRCSPISAHGMVEMYQHQALWDNRQHPRVYQAFCEILDETRLWVSLDRANMKPPARADRPEWSDPGMIHWDLDTSLDPIPFKVQGVLYLTDTTEDQGGFQCVPGFHRTFYEWVKGQAADRDPRRPDLGSGEYGTVQSIPGRAGDLLIWHSLLAHGNGHNTSERPRLAQYITMSPADEDDAELREARVASWRECRPMARWPGDPRGREQQLQQPATLTPLGQRLLGLEHWSDK